MADCSKTEVFIKEQTRMCIAAGDCEKCDMVKFAKSVGEKHCGNVITKYPKDAIRIVQKWSDEHPKQEGSNE